MDDVLLLNFKIIKHCAVDTMHCVLLGSYIVYYNWGGLN